MIAARLHERLAELEETLRAIRSGEVDAVVGAGGRGLKVFTLEGAEHAYRVLIESMNEGALTLTVDKTILYANECFSRMVKCPLEQVAGGSFRRFLSAEDLAKLRLLLKKPVKSGSKLQVLLNAEDGSKLPVQISVKRLPRNGFKHAPFAMVVTDLTESRRTEELLRALTRRVVQVQEAERVSVALELHDNITQLLIGVLFHSQALTGSLSASNAASRLEAAKLNEMLGKTANEVERIARDLRPSALEHIGLGAVVRDTTRAFAERTGMAVKIACVELTVRLAADAELALYRILQEALKNVTQHARATNVTVCLRLKDAVVELSIKDDGIGFDAHQNAARRKGKGVLGLLGMRERAAHVGAVLTVKSGRRAGTEIGVSIPLSPPVTVPS